MTGQDQVFAGAQINIPNGRLLESEQLPSRILRGFGMVSASGSRWQMEGQDVSLVSFQCQSNDKARILASKYIADIQNYGAVQRINLSDVQGVAFEVRHGGVWLVGIDGDQVQVLSTKKPGFLGEIALSIHANQWQTPSDLAYPRYLDNFDNAGLGIWWMPNTKTPEQMDWFKHFPAIGNLHYQGQNMIPAPGVYDTTGVDNAVEQMHEAGKIYRHMLWSKCPVGLNPWFNGYELPGHNYEQYPEGHSGGRRLFDAGGYNTNQVVSPIVRTMEQDALIHMMRNRVNDPNLLAWMEPHGEFHQNVPSAFPPNYQTRYPAYLQMVKKYSLATLSVAHTGHRDAYSKWSDVPVCDTAYFYGRRDQYVDLDDIPWRWNPQGLADGEKGGFFKPDFDDSQWASNYRSDKIVLSQFFRTGGMTPLWSRFTKSVSADFLKATQGRPIYMHIMPFTSRAGKWVTIWLNGEKIADKLQNDKYFTGHVQLDITGKLKAGDNQFVIYSNGGRIAYRVFLSEVDGKDYPFEDAFLNQKFLDWRDYLTWEKVQTLTSTLRVMRSVDPVRPIKVMTPRMIQGEALDLMERYGAYPQLTGEGAFYRPMHYKGYSRLRHLPASSEPSQAASSPREAQHLFAMIFAESQDTHDYVFDFNRDFWRYPEVVAWWKQNQSMLQTVGKTDLVDPTFGLLRDTRGDSRYDDDANWNWDLSRGPLPSLGLTPVLVEGMELERGLADNLSVVMDTATPVMAPEMIDAVTRYVQQGGTFVAMFNTGQHEPTRRDTYPLARAFGLTVKPTRINAENYNNWPLGKIKFTQEQNLIPSLKGKTCEGSGVSIDYMDVIRTGAISIESNNANATPIAYWEDGSMAIVEVKRGTGRLILLGTPFTYRFRDVMGHWLNQDDRQEYLKEMLNSLGIVPETTSSDPSVWFERRASKNGLYDVYFANAIGIRDKKWKLEDQIKTQLTATLRGDEHVIEASAPGMPEVQVSVHDGKVIFGDQILSPFGIRQFAMIRPNVGLEAPLHWLKVQWGHWRALEPVPASLALEVEKQAQIIAKEMGEAGMDLTSDWSVRIDPKDADKTDWVALLPDSSDWIKGSMGTWRANGWADATCVQYRRQVSIPAQWLESSSRIYLGLSSTLIMGLHGKGILWVDGKMLDDSLPRHFLIDVTDAVADGQLDLAMQVQSDELERGPGGSMFLRRTPAPMESMLLDKGWVALKSWDQMGESLSLPLNNVKMFGLKCEVAIPASWAGHAIRLVIEPMEGQSFSGISGLFIGRDDYIRNEDWYPQGMRIDKGLVPGQSNTIILMGVSHHQGVEYKGFTAKIKSIRLERMP